MKKIILFSVLFISMFSQLKFSEFRLGKLNPKGIDSGIFGSISTGAMFDANLGYNIELGLFSSKYSKELHYGTTVNGQTTATTTLTEFEQSATFMPLLLKFNYVKELGKVLLAKSDFGIGYGLLWNKIDKYGANEVHDTDFFSGFIWQAGADIGVQLSTKGSFFVGVYYNGGSFSGSKRLEENYPVYDEVNLNGLGFRATVRVDGLGLF